MSEGEAGKLSTPRTEMSSADFTKIDDAGKFSKVILSDGIDNEVDLDMTNVTNVIDRAKSYFISSVSQEGKMASEILVKCLSMDTSVLPKDISTNKLVPTSLRFLHHLNTYAFCLKTGKKTVGIVFDDALLLNIFRYCKWTTMTHGLSGWKSHIPGNVTTSDAMKIIYTMKRSWVNNILSTLDNDNRTKAMGKRSIKDSLNRISYDNVEITIPKNVVASNSIFKWFPHFIYETGIHMGDLYCLESDGLENVYVSGTKVKVGNIHAILSQMGFDFQFVKTTDKNLVMWIQPSRSIDILSSDSFLDPNDIHERRSYISMNESEALESLKARRAFMFDENISIQIEDEMTGESTKKYVNDRYDPFAYISQMGSVLCYMRERMGIVENSIESLISYATSDNSESTATLRVRLIEFKNALWVFLNFDSRYIPYIPNSGTILSQGDPEVKAMMNNMGFNYESYDVSDVKSGLHGPLEYRMDDNVIYQRGKNPKAESLEVINRRMDYDYENAEIYENYGIWRLPRLFCVAFGKIMYEKLAEFERNMNDMSVFDDDVSASRFISEKTGSYVNNIRYYSKPCTKNDMLFLRSEYQKYRKKTRGGKKFNSKVTQRCVNSTDGSKYVMCGNENILDLNQARLPSDPATRNCADGRICEYAHLALQSDSHDVYHYGSVAGVLFSGSIFNRECLDYHICNNMHIIHPESPNIDNNLSGDDNKYSVKVKNEKRAILGRGTDMSIEDNTKYIVRRAHVDCFDSGYPVKGSGVMDSIAGMTYALSFNEYMLPSTKILEQIDIFDGVVERISEIIRSDAALSRKEANAMLLSVRILYEVFECLLTDLVNTFVQYLKINGVPASFNDADAFKDLNNFSATYYYMIEKIKSMGKSNLNDFDPESDIDRMIVIQLCRMETRNKTLESIGETMSYFVFMKVSLIKIRNFVFNVHPDSRDRSSQIDLLNTLSSSELEDGLRNYMVKDSLYYDWKLSLNRLNENKAPDMKLGDALKSMNDKRKNMLSMESMGLKLLMKIHISNDSVDMVKIPHEGNIASYHRLMKVRRERLYKLFEDYDDAHTGEGDGNIRDKDGSNIQTEIKSKAEIIRDGWFSMVYVVLLNSAWNPYLGHALTEYNRSMNLKKAEGGKKGM